jgi:hypothetical protein
MIHYIPFGGARAAIRVPSATTSPARSHVPFTFHFLAPLLRMKAAGAKLAAPTGGVSRGAMPEDDVYALHVFPRSY